jgi:predicted nucleic acid-binding protein
MRRSAGHVREPRARYAAEPCVLIDSNILIDVLDDDPRWAAWSESRLADFAETGRAVINPIIYAELAAGFASLEQLEAAIGGFMLIREALPWEAAFLASRAYLQYRRRGGSRRSPMPDFYIGAHASLAGHALLTRDPLRYREYFPRLDVIAPESP